MGLYALGAESNADKETRILRLKSYLETSNPNSTDNTRYNTLTALEKAQITSWRTLLSYLKYIENNYTLTPKGQENLAIAKRETAYIIKKKK